MVDTAAQQKAEKWVVANFLPRRFDRKSFSKRKMKLTWGGEFDVDAVSTDGRIVVLISTSTFLTTGGKSGAGKCYKIMKDTLYLLHVKNVSRRVLAFSDKSMLEHFEQEKRNGRFPPEIELLHVPLPADIQRRVVAARRAASAEVSPRGKNRN